jgi:hypothetical protein
MQQAEAKEIAGRITARLGVKVICYEVVGLHDRFLIVDDRVWHVGPSFNKLGEQFSAIVEMHDPRRIAEVVKYLDGFAVPTQEIWRT